MSNGEWVSVSNAATVLGLSTHGIRKRIERGKLTATRSNRGNILVWLEQTRTVDTVDSVNCRQSEQDVESEAGENGLILELRRQIAALQTEHQRQLAELKNDHANLIQQSEARHRAELERYSDQVKAERSFWIETKDSSDIRAEQAEARSTELSRMLAELVTRKSRPWWRAWL